MKYEQLDVNEQRAAIQGRIYELERQHLTITLRLKAPDMNMAGTGPNSRDLQVQNELERGIAELRGMMNELGNDGSKK